MVTMKNTNFVVLISADAEWRVVRNLFPGCKINRSVNWEWFSHIYSDFPRLIDPVIFLHGGWGKVNAAASTQLAINTWRPRVVINLGTCGGFEGKIARGEIILVDKTIIYDIYEQMGDVDEHIRYYSTVINNTWLTLPYPIPVLRTLLVSGDRDLLCNEIPELKLKYNAIAGDWESGAIAWVTNKNHTQCLILRGVTDLVGIDKGDAYGNLNYYYEMTEIIMNKLVDSLPNWMMKYIEYENGLKLKE
jgi:adenosylhomocysteine nucleosidase